MLKSTGSSLMLLLAVALLAGCAVSQQAGKAPQPAVGVWHFSVDMMRGVQQGILTILEADDSLSGTIDLEALPRSLPLENVMFDGSELSFSFDSRQFGVMNVNVTVEGDAFNGDWSVAAMGVSVPMTGMRLVQ